MYNTPGLYRIIQFATFLCKVVDKNKRKKLMNNHRQKQDCKAMEPPKKEIFLKKKQVSNMKNKQEIWKKNFPKSSLSDELCTLTANLSRLVSVTAVSFL